MVEVTFMRDGRSGEEDEHLTKAFMEHAPRVGEKIWLLPLTKWEQSSWGVTGVAHWVSDSPGFSNGYHKVAVFMKPIK